MIPRRTQHCLLAASLLAVLFAAVPAQAETPVRVTLNSGFDGPSAPLLLALDKDFTQAEKLDVSVDAAPDSTEAIRRVATGAFDIGFADINTLIRFRDNNAGAPKAVFVVFNRGPFAIIGRKSRGVAKSSDLEGKRLGAPLAGDSTIHWALFAQVNGIDASKVTVETVGVPVRDPMLAAGQVDAIAGSALSSFIDLKERGVPLDDIVVMRLSDYGVELYGRAIIVSPKFAAEHPEAVKAFVRAYLRGLKDSVKSPAAAIDSVIKRDTSVKKAVELERLTLAIRDNILTTEVKANGYGGIDAARFDKAAMQLAGPMRLRTTPRADDIFDASFLPPAAERKAN